ncbi:Ig-like domain-containing protein [Paenibacillus sp. FA6]|uniref:Ig-like domain-containing protein n=1 Tax=Paenibacillus sp. FA6 TaxID=3413029 RepID=UPI003F658BCE
MKKIGKIRKWMKRPLAVLCSLTLVASSFSTMGLPSKVEAAGTYPGGTSTNLALWLKANDGIADNGAGTLTGWTDQTGTNNFAVKGTPGYTANGVNFNPVVNFTGNSGNNEAGALHKLEGDKEITYADAYVVFNNPAGVVVGSSTGGKNYGPAIFSKEGKTFYAAGNGGNSTYTTFNFPTGNTQPRMANTDIGGSEHKARLDGVDQTLIRKETFTPLPFTPVIASTLSKKNGSNYVNFNGDIAEVIVYSGSTAGDRAKIETYLAVKYGITLDGGASNYIATNGDIVWEADSTYKHNIAGIGLDEAEGLNQKQSRSVNPGRQVAIGLSSLAETNATHNGLLIDKQYLIWGDNGADMKFTQQVGITNQNHAERIWKVQNNGNVEGVEIAIPMDAILPKSTLLVSDSADFTTATEYKLTEITLNGAAHYAAKATLKYGQYFTFAVPAPIPVSAALEQVVAGKNEIIVTFDQEVELTDLSNFTITVDGKDVSVADMTFEMDPTDETKLILTLPNGTDVTDKAVKVSYEGLGNLKGKNGVPVNGFTKEAVEPFAAALTIVEPSDHPVTVLRPDITGKAETGSEVTVVIKDTSGNPITGAGGTTTVDNNGDWTFIPYMDLPDGTYTIEVTATKGGKSATRTKEIEVVIPEPIATITEPSGNKVNVTKPVFEGTTDVGAVVTVEIKDKDGKVIGTPKVTVNADGSWSFTPDSDLADGDYTVEVTATKGGKSATESKAITVEAATGPTLAITAPNGNTVNVAKPVFEGTTDVGDTVTVEIKDKDGKVIGTPKVTVNADGSWSFTPEIDLADGDYTFEVTATIDGKSTTESKGLKVDTTDHSSLTGLQLNSSNNGTSIGLSPVFNGASTHYTASVTNSVYGVTVIPTALNPDAKLEVSVNNAEYQGAASDHLPLNVGVNTIVVKVTDAKGKVTKYTLIVTRADSGTTTPPTGPTSPTAPTTPTGLTGPTTSGESEIDTSVNGKEGTFATGKTSTSGDRTTTSVQVNLDKLAEELAKGNGQKLAIHSSKDGDVKVDGLTAETVKQLSDKGASLEISNPLAIYPVPGKKMDLSGVSEQLGNTALGDIAVHIDIKSSSDALINKTKSKATAGGYELLVNPVDLDLTFSHDGKTVRSGQLNAYAAKYIALPAGIDPNRITTGVIVNPDGSVLHVPTVVTKIDNRYYALINDLRSHGSYSVIWNPQDFDDVKGHWGKADVNNIAARLDLAGTGNNTFSPNRNVTRSEFAEIVVHGLGLMLQDAPQSQFPDVPEAAWYRNSVAIANEFGIVLGYSNGKFEGNDQITREQGIVMVARAYELITQKGQLDSSKALAILAQYTDGAKVSGWAKESVARMIDAGIVKGDSASELLAPKANMTRAEVTALIARLLKTTNLIDK